MSADPMPLDGRVHRLDGELYVRLAGDIDLATAPYVSALCEDAFDGTCPRIVLDFTDVDFIDSSGLAALVELRNRLERGGGVLAVRGPNDAVRRLLSLTRIDEIVQIC